MPSLLIIDKVQSQQNFIKNVDLFEIEWFETRKYIFKRSTKSGVELLLQKETNNEWEQADALYANGKLIAQICIKKTLVIQFISSEEKEVADFCFYIGNRHLPLFVDKNSNIFYVPYDGNLFEQLIARFESRISLVKQQLLSKLLIQK